MKRYSRRMLAAISTLVICAFCALTAIGTIGRIHREGVPQAQRLSSAEGLYCALSAPELGNGALVRVYDAEGSIVHTATLNLQGDALLGPLLPERAYILQFENGTQGSFYLQSNASLSATKGSLRTDGELLYYLPASVLQRVRPLLPSGP